jgi:hypothetical protein
MSSRSYGDLGTRLDEVRVLSGIDPLRQGDASQPSVSNAVNRGCLVLLSAHLEGYLEDLVLEAIDYLVQAGIPVDRLPLLLRALHVEDHLRQMEQMRDRNARAPRIERMFAREAPMWAAGGQLQQTMMRPTMVCAEMDNPGSTEIRQFLELLGVDLEEHLTQRGVSDLLRRINGLVFKRNGVAHGEVTASATHGDVDDYIVLVTDLCGNIDAAMAGSLRDICSLTALPW